MNKDKQDLYSIFGVHVSPNYFWSSSVFKNKPREFITKMKNATLPPKLKINIHD